VTGQDPTDDRRFMAMAIEEARQAAAQGEVPVGAVLVAGGEVLASRGNERERLHDPTAHAEMLVLRDAAALLGGWRLQDTTLYVTLEPCAMCAGAMVLARVKRLVYGADDPKAGAAGSVLNVADHPALNHRPEVLAGIMATDASAILREFFESRRGQDETRASAARDETCR
jgi:tRNA(adenine34) deaminase